MSKKANFDDLVEKKRSKEGLNENFLMLQNILEKAADGICVCHNIHQEPFVRFTHWNPSMTGITGYTMEEINQRGWYQAMYPDPTIQNLAIERMTKMREGKDIQAEEWVITTKSGQNKTLSISTSVVKKIDEEVHVLAIMQDITKRKLVEKRLQESEEKYRLLAEYSADVIYKINIENEKVTYVSPSIKKLLGYTIEEGLLLQAQDILTSGSYIKQGEKLLEALANKKAQPEILQLEAVHKDGRIVPIEIHASILLDVNENPIEILGMVRDISDRKQVEEELKKSKTRYQFLAENMADIVWTTNMDFQTTYVSPSIENMLGFTPEERRKQKLEETVTPESLQRAMESMQHELRMEEDGLADPDRSVTIDMEYYHKNGSTAWMENSVKGIRAQDGVLIGLIGSSRNISDRKRVEKALKEEKAKLQKSEYYLKQAQTVAGIGSWHLDIINDVLTWTEETYRMFNIELGKPLNTAIFLECVHPEDRMIVESAWQSALDGEAYDIEHRIMAGNIERWIHEKAKIKFDHSGLPLEAIGTALDITDSKKATQAVLDAKIEWERTFEAVPDAIFILDLKYRIIKANTAVSKLLGLSMDSIEGKLCYDLVHGTDTAPPFCPHSRLILDGAEHTQEVYEDRLKIHCLVSVSPLFDENGILKGCVHVARDITKLKMTEIALQKAHDEMEVRVNKRTAELKITNEKLLKEIQEREKIALEFKESEERFKDLLTKLTVGVSVFYKDKAVYQNDEYQNLLGYVPESMKRPNFDMIHPEDAEKVKMAYQQTITKQIHSKDLIFRVIQSRENGEKKIKWIQCKVNSIKYKNDSALLIILMDISELKEFEQVVNMQDKMSSLGRISAGIAHEIRNPLSTINVYLSTLKSVCQNISSIGQAQLEEITSMIDRTISASNKIENVIKRVLDFSKPSRPKLSKTSINDCIEEAIKLTRVTLSKSGIGIQSHLKDSVPQCALDFQTIVQVLLNIITNAVEAMKGVTFDKHIQIVTDHDDEWVIIKVIDNGPGIEKEQHDKIFDPFYSTKPTGSGIGLSISQRIINDHGGSILLDENCVKGTSFIIKIPKKRK